MVRGMLVGMVLCFVSGSTCSAQESQSYQPGTAGKRVLEGGGGFAIKMLVEKANLGDTVVHRVTSDEPVHAPRDLDSRGRSRTYSARIFGAADRTITDNGSNSGGVAAGRRLECAHGPLGYYGDRKNQSVPHPTEHFLNDRSVQ